MASTTPKMTATIGSNKGMKTMPEPVPNAAATSYIPKSVHYLANRLTGSTTSSPTPTATGLGQLVIASTKQFALPSALCGFVPYVNGTSSSLEMFGCQYHRLVGNSLLTFNDLDACIATDSRFFCVYSGTPHTDASTTYTIFAESTGSVELSQGTLISLSKQTIYTVSSVYSTYISTITEPRNSGYSTETQSVLYWSSYYLTTTYAYTTCEPDSSHWETMPVNPYTFNIVDPCWTECKMSHSTGNMDMCSSVATVRSIQLLNLSNLQKMLPMTVILSSAMSSTYTIFSFQEMYTSKTLQPSGTDSAVDSSPSAYFGLIRSNPPSCVNVLNSTCTSIYNASQRCWSEAFPPGPQNCLCDTLAVTNCTQICQLTPNDRISYFNWAMNLCGSYTSPINSINSTNSTNGLNGTNSINNATFSSIWPEVQNRTIAISEDLMPFAWNISAKADARPDYQCPSNAMKLASFAINNAIVAIGTILLGRRTVAKWLTRGECGIAGSKLWPNISILVVGINIFANFINAVIVKRTSGFTSPDMGTLVLLWATRPRSAWVATALIPIEKDRSMYISTGVVTLLSEIMLQTIGGAFMVETLSFIAQRGYIQPKYLQYIPGSSSALIMYSGDLVWIISIAFFYIFMAWAFLIWDGVFLLLCLAIWNGLKSFPMIVWDGLKFVLGMGAYWFRRCWGLRNSDEYQPDGELQAEEYMTKPWEEYLEQMGLGSRTLKTVSISRASLVLFLPYVGQWLFWVGFVELYSDQYCLPVIWQTTIVWTVFELIGIFLSATQ